MLALRRAVGVAAANASRSLLLLRRSYGVPATAAADQDEDDNAPSAAKPLPLSAIPQPKGMPVVGHLLLARKYQEDVGPNNLGLHKMLYHAHGPIYQLSYAGTPMVFVSSPEYDKVFHAEGRYPKGVTAFLWPPNAVSRRHPELASFFSLLATGEAWREARHKLQPFIFSLDTSKGHQPHMVPAARRASAALPNYVAQGRLKALTHRAAFDMFTAVAADLDTDCVEGGSPISAEALEFVETVTENMGAMMAIMNYKPLESHDFVLDRWEGFQVRRFA
jgi:hypothetical protein